MVARGCPACRSRDDSPFALRSPPSSLSLCQVCTRPARAEVDRRDTREITKAGRNRVGARSPEIRQPRVRLFRLLGGSDGGRRASAQRCEVRRAAAPGATRSSSPTLPSPSPAPLTSGSAPPSTSFSLPVPPGPDPCPPHRRRGCWRPPSWPGARKTISQGRPANVALRGPPGALGAWMSRCAGPPCAWPSRSAP